MVPLGRNCCLLDGFWRDRQKQAEENKLNAPLSDKIIVIEELFHIWTRTEMSTVEVRGRKYLIICKARRATPPSMG